jgi:hypothetical protein
MKRLICIFALAILVLAMNAAILAAPTVDRLLTAQLNASPLTLTPVVITFNRKPAAAEFQMLRSLGITGVISNSCRSS